MAGLFDDLPDAKPAPQQPAQQPAGLFDDLPAVQAAPDPTTAIAAQRHPMVLPKGGAVISPQTQAQAIVSGRDLGREIAQDATFNYSDEAIAGVRAAFGEDYAKALEDERAQLSAGEERIGRGGRAAAMGLSFLMPMGPVARSIQRLAGPGAGVLKTALASGAVMAPVGGVSAVGALDDKGDIAKDAAAFTSGAKDAAAGAVLLNGVGVPILTGAGYVARTGKDLVNRGLEVLRRDNPVPLQSTTDYAVSRIADEAEKGGARTAADIQNAIQANAVPDTPSALVNTGNDRLVALGADSAYRLQDPNVPRIVNGQRRDDNLFQALEDAQARNANGQTQGDAFRERLFDNANVDPWERNLPDVRQHDQNRLALSGDQLAALDARPNGLPFREGRVPGFTQAVVDTPDLANAYRQAARDVGIAGSPDSIRPDQIPLLPEDYNAAVAHHQANGGPVPVALTDTNVPMSILSQIRQQISALSASEDPIMRARGARLMSLYDNLTSGNGSSGAVRQLTDINRNMHGLHNRQEDISAGYKLPAKSGITRADALANIRTQHPMQTPAQGVARQNDVGLGLTHSVADASKANEGNIGSLADDLFANPDFRAAYDEFTSARNPQARGASAVANELENIGNMQGTSSMLRNASEGRQLNPESLPAEAARAAVKFHISPSFGTAWFLQKWLNGGTQARYAEISRLLTDTSGDGLDRLMLELGRRAARRNAPSPILRLAITNEIARQLGQSAQSNQ